MSPVSPRPRQPTQSEKLAAAMRKHGLNPRKLARIIAGEDASPKQLDSRRSQISKWANPRTDKVGDPPGFSDESAAILAEAFEAIAPGEYPPDYFMKPRERRTSLDDLAVRFAQIESRKVDREQYQRAMRRLRSEWRAELSATRDELREEIRRLREAS